jgi:hypothetical protein
MTQEKDTDYWAEFMDLCSKKIKEVTKYQHTLKPSPELMNKVFGQNAGAEAIASCVAASHTFRIRPDKIRRLRGRNTTRP